MRDLATAEVANVVFGDIGRRVTQLDPSGYLLAVPFIRDTDDLNVRDVGMGEQKLLDLTRINVFSAPNDDILYTTDDVDVPSSSMVARSPVCIHPSTIDSCVFSSIPQ